MTAFNSLINRYLKHYKDLPFECWQGIIVIFLEACVISITFFLSVYFVDYLKLDIAISGAIFSSYGIGTVLGGYSWGLLSDQVSPIRIAIINLIIEAVSVLLLVKLQSSVSLVIDLFLMGFVTYGFMTSINIWILGQCKQSSPELTKTLNLSRVAMNAGFGVSGIIISFATNYDFQKIFYLYASILILAILYLLFFTKESTTKTHLLDIRKELKTTRNSRISQNKEIIIIASICLFLTGLIISQLTVTYPVFIKERFPNLGIKAISYLFILDTIVIVLFQAPLVNFLSEKCNLLLMIGLGAFLMGFGMLILQFSFNFTLAVISCLIWTIGEMIFLPITQLIFYQEADKNKKGKGLGLYQSIYASSKIIGPTLGSFIYYYCGGSMVWYYSAFIGTVCLVLCNHFKKRVVNYSYQC